MRQCKVAFRNLIHRCKSITTRPLCCGVELLGKQQLILPLYTCTTSSPRNYSKFSTHITTERAMNLLCNLDEEERSNLRSALDKIDADKEKKLYEKLPIKYIENRTSISYSSQRKEWNINGKITQVTPSPEVIDSRVPSAQSQQFLINKMDPLKEREYSRSVYFLR
ncbi:uncharacterized protein [Drosophila suzukii]|uniref:Uncharacterized protein isoform X7 n=1 Tax=Drosophila suzukii TaxID=28584 RepID=A0ABM4TWM6_DROSZ|nr:uncharacterized protein LOC108015917 isoform X6 [Drosophila suzukii]